MAKAKTEKTETAAAAAGPVVAVNRVVYGKGQTAPAKSMFVPVSQREHDDLFALGAVREPTDAELALFKQTQAAAPAPVEAPAGEAQGSTEENPLGRRPVSRFRDNKRRMRGDVHREMSVAALYIPAPTAEPVPCTVRLWLKTDQMVGELPGFEGAQRAEPADRIRFTLAEFAAPPRRLAAISVETGEAYRIDHLDPADLSYQTARVTRLSAAEADGLPVPV